MAGSQQSEIEDTLGDLLVRKVKASIKTKIQSLRRNEGRLQGYILMVSRTKLKPFASGEKRSRERTRKMTVNVDIRVKFYRSFFAVQPPNLVP